jgi:hypothetical protein
MGAQLCLAVAVGLAGVVEPALSQRISTTAEACSVCTIELQRVTVLGRAGAKDTPVRPVAVVQDSSGRFYVLDRVYPQERILLFEADGAFRGSIVPPNDVTNFGTIAVTANGAVYGFGRELRVFGPDHTNLQRSLTIADGIVPFSAVVLGDGRMIIQGMIRTADRVGYPIHVLNRDGRVLQSLGASGNAAYVAGGIADVRRIALSADGNAVWSAVVNAYRFEKWRLDGTRTAVIAPSASWFRPWSGGETSVTGQPNPRVNALREDAAGRLWVISFVANASWRPTVERSTVVDKPALTAAEIVQRFDTMVEVFDISSGARLGSVRLSGVYDSFVGQDLVSQVVPQGSESRVALWRVRLTAKSVNK